VSWTNANFEGFTWLHGVDAAPNEDAPMQEGVAGSPIPTCSECSLLRFAGMPPVRETLPGMVDAASDAKRPGWLDRMRDYGRRLI